MNLLFIVVLLLPPQETAAATPTAQQVYAEANLLFEKRENDKALAAYERAIALEAGQADFHIGRCRSLARLSRHAEAIPACSEAQRLRPRDAAPLRWRGHFHLNLRQFDLALADLTRAESIRKDDSDIYYHLGLAHYLTGNFKEAARSFQACLDLKHNDDDVVAASAWLYPSLVRAGKKREAAEVLNRITPQMDVKENMAYHDRLLLFKGAKSEAEVAAGMDKDALSRPTVGYGVGLWHMLNGRKAEARKYFEKCVTSEFKPAFGFVAAETELKRIR